MRPHSVQGDGALSREPERCDASEGGEMPHWWILTDHDGVQYRSRYCMHCNEVRAEVADA